MRLHTKDQRSKAIAWVTKPHEIKGVKYLRTVPASWFIFSLVDLWWIKVDKDKRSEAESTRYFLALKLIHPDRSPGKCFEKPF